MPHFEFSDLIVLLSQITSIVFVSRSLGLVTRWMGQPLVIAEVLAGILLGPSLLGWLSPQVMNGLFPTSSLPTLKLLSQVGLLLFMFLIGLELDPKLLRGRTHSSVAISHTSIVVPFGLGALVALWLYGTYSPPAVSLTSFVLFLGISMSVTAFPVLARILSERQLMSSRVGAIAIACAAVDDVTAWCLLAVVVAVARSQGLSSAMWTTGLAVTFIVAMWFGVRPFLRRLGARVANRDGLTSTVMAGIFVLLISSSMVSELIGIHALFGAFLFGAIFPKEGKLADALIEKLESVSVVLFLPLFFAYSGLRTQIGLVSAPSEWAVTALLTVTATLGKFGGSTIAGKLTGLRWREASAVGILMNTRGLMELIVLNIGLDIGVITPTVFTMLVIMALVTTFATTPALQWIYPQRELARDRLVEPFTAASPTSPAPTILMCVSDHNPGAGLALVASALLGQRQATTRLLALHLWRPSDRPSVEQRRAASNEQSGPLHAIIARARELALDVQPLEYVSSDVGKDICRTAEAVQASIVLVGAHKPLLLEGNFGGIVREVIEHAKSSVGVFVDKGLTKVARVLLVSPTGSDIVGNTSVIRRLAQRSECEFAHIHTDAASGRAVTSEGSDGPLLSRVQAIYADPTLVEEVTVQEAQRNYDLVVIFMTSETANLETVCQRIAAESAASVLVFHHVAQRHGADALDPQVATSVLLHTT